MTKNAGWYTDLAYEELNRKYAADIPIGKEGRLVAIVHDS